MKLIYLFKNIIFKLKNYMRIKFLRKNDPYIY